MATVHSAPGDLRLPGAHPFKTSGNDPARGAQEETERAASETTNREARMKKRILRLLAGFVAAVAMLGSYEAYAYYQYVQSLHRVLGA